MKITHSFSTLKMLTIAVALSTTAMVDAQERTRTPTDSTGAATTESTRAVQDANGNSDQAQLNANATKTAGAKSVQTDGQILQIVRTLNMGEIKQANYAMDESDNEQVKATAQAIIKDHEESNDKIDDLAKGDLSLDDSPLNDTLLKQAETTFEMLDELENPQLDCIYLQKQVEQHEMALDIARNDLVPDAKSPEVQAFLTENEPKLEHHLMEARNAMGSLSGCQQTASVNQGSQGLGSQQNRANAAPATQSNQTQSAPNPATTPSATERD
jgi:putative membrane protein